MRYKRCFQAPLYFWRHSGEQPLRILRYVRHWVLAIRAEQVVVKDCAPSLSFARGQISKCQQTM